jgi:hypothetical protein
MIRYLQQFEEVVKTIPLFNSSKGMALAVLFAVLALSGCVTSNEVLFNALATPVRPGTYELQYSDGDGKWTKFATGSLALVNRRYTWTETSEMLPLLPPSTDNFKFVLADIGNGYFIIVVASADLRDRIWAGNYRYGIARRAAGAFLYDFPSCLDVLVSQGFPGNQIDKGDAQECRYSNEASLAGALTTYAKRMATWKRLAPSSH